MKAKIPDDFTLGLILLAFAAGIWIGLLAK